MKILVTTKRVPDTDQKITVRENGTAIDDSYLPYIMNPFDAIALEEAVRIRETGRDAEIVAIGIGSDDYKQQLRTALAMGADRALLVECPLAPDPWNVARILRAVVQREQPDLLLMGKQAVDDDASQAGQMLAAILDWPQATFASQIELVDDVATVERETDDGIEMVRVRLPAVITADLRLNEPRYASLPSIMRARKKPIEQLTLDELDIQLEPRIEVLALHAVTSQRSCRKVNSADELLAALRDQVKVI
jgi:electron transfer flavoprotein beta subunit